MVQPMLVADRVAGAGDNSAPTQVWGALATEQQERVIRLMAQLACTFATAPVAPPHQEARYVDPPRQH